MFKNNPGDKEPEFATELKTKRRLHLILLIAHHTYEKGDEPMKVVLDMEVVLRLGTE